MTPTQVMEGEHRLIETVVRSLGGMAAAIEKGHRVELSLLEGAVEFLRLYADKLHHGKEEALFFPMLVKCGFPSEGCPIGVLNGEHVRGRVLVRSLAEHARAQAEGKPNSEAGLLEALRGIFDLYQKHIWKEDTILFPVANRVFTAGDQAELSKQFSEADRAIGRGTLAHLERLAKSLATCAPPLSPSAVWPPCRDCQG